MFCESEIKLKDLFLQAEEFEILFDGQLSSVKALQVRLFDYWRFELGGFRGLKICGSEIKAKDLSLKEEFKTIFNGQLSSVKALQARF